MEPPLCANCVVEAEGDALDEKAILRNGLERVENVDGGITRQRWEFKLAELGTTSQVAVDAEVCS